MANDKFMLISLDDEKSKSVAEVLSSSSCKKIINHLAENKEASEKDLSNSLHMPLNTVEYNINKLLNSGFVQKRKNFFWSKKGKKIVMYELSNKSVVISHKKPSSEKLKSIVPAFILTAVGTFALWVYQKIQANIHYMGRDTYSIVSDASEEAVNKALTQVSSLTPSAELMPTLGTPLWLWFLIGSLLAIFIISIVNWRKL